MLRAAIWLTAGMLASGVLQLHGKMRLIGDGDGGWQLIGEEKKMRLRGDRKRARIAAATME